MLDDEGKNEMRGEKNPHPRQIRPLLFPVESDDGDEHFFFAPRLAASKCTRGRHEIDFSPEVLVRLWPLARELPSIWREERRTS